METSDHMPVSSHHRVLISLSPDDPTDSSSVHFTLHKLYCVHSLHKCDSVQLHVQTDRERHVFILEPSVLCVTQEVYF